MQSFADSVKKLCDASVKSFLNPYSYISWPEAMDRNQWFISPELISIFGTPEFEALDEHEKKRLSFYEAVNFFSLNIHGEKPLVEGLARRLYSKTFSEYVEYLHHFLDEENKHMIYFGGFCQRYVGKIYRDRKMSIPREYAPGEEDFLFFAKVMIFEEIVDVYNVQISLDERVEKTARQINNIHHLEEARHLVFGRQMVKHLFQQHSPNWDAETLESVQSYLSNYIVATWKEYYNPDVYRDALQASGSSIDLLPSDAAMKALSRKTDPYDLVEAAWRDPACRQHRISISSKLLHFLKENKMLTENPAL